MRTFKLSIANFVFAFVFIVASTLFSKGIQAQEAEKGFILTMTEFTVKGGHDTQFREGIKAWKACYLENGGDWTWNMWRRMNGEGTVYVLTSSVDKWAEMDETDEAGSECRELAIQLINPHVESVERNLARFMPDYSKSYPNPDPILWVGYWQVNNWTKFRDIVKDVTDVVAKEEGAPRGFWYSVMGGSKDTPDFFVATPFADFAAMDVDSENVWTIYENEQGKKKRDETQAAFREVVDASWSYLFKKAEDLSHSPSTD